MRDRSASCEERYGSGVGKQRSSEGEGERFEVRRPTLLGSGQLHLLEHSLVNAVEHGLLVWHVAIEGHCLDSKSLADASHTKGVESVGVDELKSRS